MRYGGFGDEGLSFFWGRKCNQGVNICQFDTENGIKLTTIPHSSEDLEVDVAKLYRFWFTFAMTYYDRIFEEAIGNYGLITSSQDEVLSVFTAY